VITASIVSHGHGAMLPLLVASLTSCPEVTRIVIICNIPEQCLLPSDPKLIIQHNTQPLGFGANHNAAFRFCKTPYFCVLNPDIKLIRNPFSKLITCIEQNNAALAAPIIQSPSGQIEDSIRHFPTPVSLFRKALGGSDGRYWVPTRGQPCFPDWVAGMFMLFRSSAFRSLAGFDERFFLYYEDVDICARLWRCGKKIVACSNVHAVHAARRTSRRNVRYALWHLQGMGRYLLKHFGRMSRS
jgi:GT2 family glycosyltransferase